MFEYAFSSALKKKSKILNLYLKTSYSSSALNKRVEYWERSRSYSWKSKCIYCFPTYVVHIRQTIFASLIGEIILNKYTMFPWIQDWNYAIYPGW